MNQNVQVNTVKPELSFFENEVLNRLLNFDRELLLDSKSEEVEDFMKNNPGHGLSEEVKDVLYGNAQNLYNEYKKALRDVKFNFYLNRPQYNLLTDLILKKLEYFKVETLSKTNNVDLIFRSDMRYIWSRTCL